MISSHDSKRPSFRNQTVLDTDQVLKLDAENTVFLTSNFLARDLLKEYAKATVATERYRPNTSFGPAPREERIYDPIAESSVYSRVVHKAFKYPKHIKRILPLIQEAVQDQLPDNIYTKLSTGIDICYSSKYPRGGSIGAHRDKEDPNWGLIVIFTLGQTRWLRVRNIATKEWTNIEMKHNSLVAMHGKTFQKLYTHQVDKLGINEPVYSRYSLNIRYTAE